MRRADEFLQLLNELDDWLKAHADRRQKGFVNRLDSLAHRNLAVSRHRDDLREFAELRNSIVHHRRYPQEVIAEPLESAVEELRRIVAEITDPPRLLPRFKRKVRSFRSGEPLLEALAFLRQEQHTQVPVEDGGRLALLTSDGITRWLAESSADGLDLAQATVASVLPYEREAAFEVLSGRHSIEDARAAFMGALKRGIRLRAVLITQDGQRGPVLGIVTPSDLLE